MAVRLVSDLVMDVMRAAEPARADAAMRKLAAGPVADTSATFSRAMASAQSPKQLSRDIVADVMGAAEPGRLAAATTKLGGKPSDVAGVSQQFQSVLLASALDGMMPHGENGLYGSGTAGQVWRGMANDQMAQALAARDVLGLDQTLSNRMGAAASPSAWPFRTSNHIRPFTIT